MKRIIAAAIAVLALGAAAPVAAQSWSVVHELEGMQGVVAVRWRLWQSHGNPARLREEVVAAATAPACVGMIIQPQIQIDTSTSIGNYIMPMRPENRALVLARVDYAAGQTFQSQMPMQLIQQPIGADGRCAPNGPLQPTQIDAMLMLPTLSDEEIGALIQQQQARPR